VSAAECSAIVEGMRPGIALGYAVMAIVGMIAGIFAMVVYNILKAREPETPR
jgi:biopolymer transport protein ExbB/TolQ